MSMYTYQTNSGQCLPSLKFSLLLFVQNCWLLRGSSIWAQCGWPCTLHRWNSQHCGSIGWIQAGQHFEEEVIQGALCSLMYACPHVSFLICLWVLTGIISPTIVLPCRMHIRTYIHTCVNLPTHVLNALLVYVRTLHTYVRMYVMEVLGCKSRNFTFSFDTCCRIELDIEEMIVFQPTVLYIRT